MYGEIVRFLLNYILGEKCLIFYEKVKLFCFRWRLEGDGEWELGLVGFNWGSGEGRIGEERGVSNWMLVLRGVF